jgi:cytochrome c6
MKKILFILFIFFLKNNVIADEKMKLGLDVYNNKAMCGTCHILKSAGSVGEIGPNLDMLKPLKAQIINAVTNGIGVMPPWDGILTSDEIEAVAYYIFNSTNK